jgi:hypothetical protein
MAKVLTDRLMDMSQRHAEEMAEIWYKSLSTNQRTKSFLAMPKAACMRHAVTIYKSLADMYFAEDCFKAVENILDVSGFAEDFYARGIPLEEVFYALVLLRRHIWLFAESEAIFNDTDMYNALDGINRVLLVFDYAGYIVARKYREFAARASRSLVA